MKFTKSNSRSNFIQLNNITSNEINYFANSNTISIYKSYYTLILMEFIQKFANIDCKCNLKYYFTEAFVTSSKYLLIFS